MTYHKSTPETHCHHEYKVQEAIRVQREEERSRRSEVCKTAGMQIGVQELHDNQYDFA